MNHFYRQVSTAPRVLLRGPANNDGNDRFDYKELAQPILKIQIFMKNSR